eukprot:scaffold28361_cov84-Phaeocystis_antarctica.AAC.2
MLDFRHGGLHLRRRRELLDAGADAALVQGGVLDEVLDPHGQRLSYARWCIPPPCESLELSSCRSPLSLCRALVVFTPQTWRAALARNARDASSTCPVRGASWAGHLGCHALLLISSHVPDDRALKMHRTSTNDYITSSWFCVEVLCSNAGAGR